MIDVLCNIVKYFQSLFSDRASNLLTGALKESCHLHESKKKSWISSIYFLLKYLNVESSSSSANLVNIFKSKLIAKYKAGGSAALLESRNNHTDKLRTYSLFKQRLCREPYLEHIRDMRGAVVEWLERLAVVRKVAGSSPARVKRLENSHCPPSSEWVHD